MKFLHTGDWHLGKVFYEQSLLQDQSFFLNHILKIIEEGQKNESYSALCIPGDIYDRSVPPAEAVELLNSFLVQAHSSFPDLKILILAGNHDSAQRLGFAKDILKSSNIFICSDTKSYTQPVIIEDTAFYQLPFLYPGSINAKDSFSSKERSQNGMYSLAVEKIIESHKKNFSDLSPVLCAHASVLGNTDVDLLHSIGTAEVVKADNFDFFTYTCLGHIHKAQNVSKSVWYSGSPLAYSFDEEFQKYFLDVKIEKGQCKVEKIPFTPLHKVVRLEGSFESFYQGKDFDSYSDAYTEIVCTDKTIVENPVELLRPKFPNLLSFVRKSTESLSQSKTMKLRRELFSSEKTCKEPEKIIELFLQELYGENIDMESAKKEVEVFTKLYNQIKQEDNE